MSPRQSSTPEIDRLIAESKQVTTDLMALRHEVLRFASLHPRSSRPMRMPADRAYLIIENVRGMSESLHQLWESMIHPPKEIEIVSARRSSRQSTFNLSDGPIRKMLL